MTTEEIKSVAADTARKLSGYPMLITMIMLVGAWAAVGTYENHVRTESMKQLVFGQLEYLQSMNQTLLGHLVTCHEGKPSE